MTGEAVTDVLTAYGAEFALIFLLLLFSAFFSGSETALRATTRARMHALEVNGDMRAGFVNRLLERRDRLVGALLLGNNLVKVLAASIATSLFLNALGPTGIAVSIIAVTILIVVFADVVPKSLAVAAPDRFALAIGRPLYVFVSVVGPVSSLINGSVRRAMRLFGLSLEKGVPMLTAHEELRGAVDLLHREGAVVKAERDRFGGVLDLDELEIADIMIHRTAMRGINADDPPDVSVRAVLESPFTRMPVWRSSTDNIIGILHSKDLLRALAEPEASAETIDIIRIAQKPWFVPETTSLTDQLNAFLRRKMHFAVVVDEYGEVQGVVTLEDILEEIVGDIADEHDLEIQGVRQEADGSIVVDGGVSIRDLNRALDWSLPDDEATTVAGLVIHESRIIPDERQSFTFYGKRFIVMKRVRNRITRLRIRPTEDAAMPSLRKRSEG